MRVVNLAGVEAVLGNSLITKIPKNIIFAVNLIQVVSKTKIIKSKENMFEYNNIFFYKIFFSMNTQINHYLQKNQLSNHFEMFLKDQITFKSKTFFWTRCKYIKKDYSVSKKKCHTLRIKLDAITI